MARKKGKPAAREAAALVVGKILDDKAYANIAVNSYLRGHELADVERRFFTELVYSTVKASGVIDALLKLCTTRPLEKIDRGILNVLRISVCQLLFIERVPASAACNEAVKIARGISHEGAAKFVNGVLRGFLRKFPKGSFAPGAGEATPEDLAMRYCHPEWLVRRWLDMWGKEAALNLLCFDNAPAPVCMRVNTLATTREALLEKLRGAGAEAAPSEWSCDGIVCARLPALGELLSAGAARDFYVQDESSMLVGTASDVAPGMDVLDLCSAPGGKSTHLAQLMLNEGSITACDVYPHKLKLVKENAARLGIGIIDAVLNDATVFKERWACAFDRVLVDAPCSGLGVLRRRAEARWRKRPEDLAAFPPVQLRILENAARYIKADGRIIYSTCTIEQAENSGLIDSFLNRNGSFRRRPFLHPLTGKPVDELQVLPQEDGIDGFYICVLERKS